MSDAFPAVGHKYLVDFTAPGARFRVQLDFTSETSMTLKPRSAARVRKAG